MNQEKIDRINELARKSKNEGLTEAEKEEQKLLRDEYRMSVTGNLAAQLRNTYIMTPDGKKRKLDSFLEGGANGFGAACSITRTNGNLICGAVGLTVMVHTVLNVTLYSLDVFLCSASIFVTSHFTIPPFVMEYL